MHLHVHFCAYTLIAKVDDAFVFPQPTENVTLKKCTFTVRISILASIS